MPDTLAVELIIEDQKATVKLDNFGQKIRLVSDDINKIGGDTKFAGKISTDFEALSKRVDDTRRQFQEISKVRIENGQFGALTKEILVAQTRSRQLASDIINIRRELANPNRTSSISFLTSELKAAEREADSLARKLNTLPNAAAASPTAAVTGGGGHGGGTRPLPQLRGYGALIRGVGSPVGELEINAISQIAGLAGITTAMFATFTGIAAAGYGIVKVTQSIREEAEKRLHVEEKIQGAINNQIIAQKDALANFQKLRDDAQFNRDFSKYIETASVDELKSRRGNAQKSLDLAPTAADADKYKKIILDIDAQLDALEKRRQKLQNDSFNQRFTDFQKSQEQGIKYETARAEKQKAFDQKKLADALATKSKIEQLEKGYLSAFDSVNRLANSSNPFVAIFTDGDKALRDLQSNLAGLPPELQKIAMKIQQQFNLKKLLESDVSNQLSVFDLRNGADNFRNPFDAGKQKKDQNEFITRFLRDNPNYLFSQNKNALDDETKAKILKQFGSSALNESPADRLNKTLDEKFSLLYKPRQSATEKAFADKQFISLTQGVNPLDLNKNLREQAALAREREAIREERYRQDAILLYREQRDYQKQIAENTKRQSALAAKDGLKSFELTLKNESEQSARLEKSPTRADTATAYYDPDLDFTGAGGLSNH